MVVPSPRSRAQSDANARLTANLAVPKCDACRGHQRCSKRISAPARLAARDECILFQISAFTSLSGYGLTSYSMRGFPLMTVPDKFPWASG